MQTSMFLCFIVLQMSLLYTSIDVVYRAIVTKSMLVDSQRHKQADDFSRLPVCVFVNRLL